jgi:short-subunit dehydrogenase
MRVPALSDRVVLITGASSGIGAAVAVECARRGADVVLVARRVTRLEDIARQVRALGRQALVARGDVTTRSDLPHAVALARERFRRIDVVVANAGFEVTGSFDELTLADFRRQFETNIFGVLRTLYSTLDDLKRARGRLALTGSMLGHVALPGTSAYSMSKFAVRALAQALRFEVARHGISVTLISPGNIATEIRRVDNHDVLHPDAKDPIPRWLQISPEQAARAIVRALISRRAECVLTPLAKLVVTTERVAPSLVTGAIKLGHIQGRHEPRTVKPASAAARSR